MKQMETFRELTDTIRKTATVEPPDDLTAQVMTSILQIKTDFYSRTWNALNRHRSFSLNPSRALRGQSNHDEMFIYFMIIAVAHLALAVVLLAGFRSVSTKILFPSIILFQPLLILFLAGCLIIGGLLLKRNGPTGIAMARAAALIYIEAAVINGALLCIEFNRVLLLIPFVTVIVGVTVAAGIFLALICVDNTLNREKTVCPGTKTHG